MIRQENTGTTSVSENVMVRSIKCILCGQLHPLHAEHKPPPRKSPTWLMHLSSLFFDRSLVVSSIA